MTPPFVVIRRSRYEEPHALSLDVRVSNGTFSGATDVYVDAAEVRAIGGALTRFPSRAGERVRVRIRLRRSRGQALPPFSPAGKYQW